VDSGLHHGDPVALVDIVLRDAISEHVTSSR
jgi:hypothetical protein